MNESANLDARRRAALERVERSERTLRNVLVMTALFETVLFAAVILLMDWTSSLHVLMLVLACMVYGSLGFGLVALAAYMKRNTLRILASIELLDTND